MLTYCLVVLGVFFGLFVVACLFGWVSGPKPAAFQSPVVQPYRVGLSAWEECNVRYEQGRKLWNLKDALHQAEQLMTLEEQAQALRERYVRRRATYSRTVETNLDAVLARIDALKRGTPSR